MLGRVTYRLDRYRKWRALRKSRRIIIGAGQTAYPGWFPTNKALLDVIDREQFLRTWPKPAVTHFLAEHVFEHLTEEQIRQALKNCSLALVQGGRVRIAVPDGYHPSPEYIAHVRPGGIGPGADDHKLLLDIDSLSNLIRESGLIPEPLEFYTKEGSFVANDWSSEDGFVMRSLKHDRRNASPNAPYKYTSLIVDALVPRESDAS